MAYFLVLQNTYSDVEVALGSDGTLVRHITISKTQASSHITLAIETLLKEEKITLHELAFLAANVGPAPFTTLRVVIATANGLSFATSKPLIALDGLATFLDEYKNTKFPITIALFNAFNHDVYFGIDNTERVMGCVKISELIAKINKEYASKDIRLIGSGVLTYKDQLMTLPNIHIPDPLPEYVSLAQLTATAWHKWQNKIDVTSQLQPLYLKKAL